MTASAASLTSSPVRSRDWARTAATRLATAVFAALRAAGEARARSELLAHAERCEALQPELAAELRAAGARLLAR